MPNHPTYKQHSGFTLIELLVTITILAVVTVFAVPELRGFHQGTLSNQYRNFAFDSINFARQSAINFRSNVILCPSADELNCSKDWSKDFIVFVDKDNDKNRSNTEMLIRKIPNEISNGRFVFRGGAKRNKYLHFRSDGSTNRQGARLVYCPDWGGKAFRREIVIHWGGRARNVARADFNKKICPASA